jgi:hypothetical protein
MTPRDTQEQEVPDEYRWKLDRHIPIAVIFAFLVQTGGAVWWAAALSGRVDTVIDVNGRQDDEINALEASQAARDVATATAAAELRALRDSLGEIKQSLADQNVLLREILTNGKGKP